MPHWRINATHPRKIFIGGLPHRTTTQHLREHFAAFGSIVDAVVLRWPDGRSRGFGYVTFAKAEAAAAALQPKHHIGGRQIDTKRAVPGTNKAFVGGLPPNCTATELREYFEAFGIVSDAVVMIDPVTNRSRGFGFVCFLPGQEGSDSMAAALAEYSNHKIRGKWIEVKNAVSPHRLALKESCPTLPESPRSLATSATELLDAPPTLLTPRAQVTLQHWKKEQMVQDSLADDFRESWKVPLSFPTKMAAVADPQSCAVRRAKDSPTASACELAAVPWLGSVHGDSSCRSAPSLQPMPGASGDEWKVGCGAGFLATSEALQQSLAELFKQESLRLKEVQVRKKLVHGGG